MKTRVIDELAPRSTGTVERLTASRTRQPNARRARFLAMLVPAFVIGGVVIVALFHSAHVSNSRVILIGLAVTFCLAVPAFASRGSMNRELPWVISLVRDAPAAKRFRSTTAGRTVTASSWSGAKEK